MDRRKFIKSSMYLGCGAALLPASQSQLLPEISYKFSKDKFIYKRKEDLPKKVRLEACSLCQLNCIKCWLRDKEKQISTTEKFGYLKFSDFKKFVDENSQLESIELASNGEIFLNPELNIIVEYAHKKNIELTANSGVNLNSLSDEMAECLVRNKFRLLEVSIDGATPEVYSIYRRGGDLNKVFANIKKINKYKEKYNSAYPSLVYKFIVFGHNEHEIELAKQKAKDLNMQLKFAPNVELDYSPIKNVKRVYEQTGIKIDNKDINPFILKFLKGNQESFIFCKQLFEEPVINWNGNFMGCCLCHFENFGVNVFKKGLMNALNNYNIRYAKQMLTDFNIKPDKNVLCSKCDIYHLMKRYNMPLIYNEVKNG